MSLGPEGAAMRARIDVVVDEAQKWLKAEEPDYHNPNDWMGMPGLDDQYQPSSLAPSSRSKLTRCCHAALHTPSPNAASATVNANNCKPACTQTRPLKLKRRMVRAPSGNKITNATDIRIPCAQMLCITKLREIVSILAAMAAFSMLATTKKE